MPTVIKATGDGACLFNAVAIGLAIEILSGRLDSLEKTPGYQALLDEFARHHPQFKPKSWKSLKDWLHYYNDSRDIELVLAPVLFNLNQRYQEHVEDEILNELTNLVWKNKAGIESGQAWFEMISLGEMGESLFAKLDGLPLKDRNIMLGQLRNILGAYHGDRGDRAAIKQFLAGHARAIVSGLRDKITSDPNAFQRGYSCGDLKGMTDALSVSLIENGVSNPADRRRKISLQNEEQHWNVIHDDNDGEFINTTPKRLKITSYSAYRGETPIAAPTHEQVVQALEPGVLIQAQDFDNPGLGNCAFYAFAIGLIHIIKEESRYNKRAMFNQWVRLDNSLANQYAAITQFDMDHPDNELLDRLQNSLRLITHHYQLAQLRRNCSNPAGHYSALTADSNFVNFAALYYGDPEDTDPRFNPFANSIPILTEIAGIDRDLVFPNYENDVLIPIFLRMVYGEVVNPSTITPETNPSLYSPVIEAMGNITQEFFWGSHLDLDHLAEAFRVNLHILTDDGAIQEFRDNPDHDTITLRNRANTHWTTELTTAREIHTRHHAPHNTTVHPLPQFNHNRTESAQKKESDARPGVGKQESLLSTRHASAPQHPSHPVTRVLQSDELRRRRQPDHFVPTHQSAESIDRRNLDRLKRTVANATIAYTTYSDNIWFSFFHRHGATGRLRAEKFNQQFARITNYADAQAALIHYLDDKKNGNTHPHSYRTMLLHELIGTRDKVSLQRTSNLFDDLLNKVATDFHVPLTSYRHGR